MCDKLQDPGEVCRNTECKANIRKVQSQSAGLRFHDLRHQAITELAESSTSEQTIMSIAGHVSAKMLAHYSHVRLEAKRDALAALSNGTECEGYVTNYVTKDPFDDEGEMQVVENMVDVAGIEPATPCLQSRCSPS
jgi:hypothetical protein